MLEVPTLELMALLIHGTERCSSAGAWMVHYKVLVPLEIFIAQK